MYVTKKEKDTRVKKLLILYVALLRLKSRRQFFEWVENIVFYRGGSYSVRDSSAIMMYCCRVYQKLP